MPGYRWGSGGPLTNEGIAQERADERLTRNRGAIALTGFLQDPRNRSRRHVNAGATEMFGDLVLVQHRADQWISGGTTDKTPAGWQPPTIKRQSCQDLFLACSLP
jgi:hypothetical protein